jgi:Flp pilus assembly pilin Flp
MLTKYLNQPARCYDPNMRIKRMLKVFLNDTSAQDLVEYIMLLAFLAAFSGALFIGAGDSISSIWRSSNSQLVEANSIAPSNAGSSVASEPVPPPSHGTQP